MKRLTLSKLTPKMEYTPLSIEIVEVMLEAGYATSEEEDDTTGSSTGSTGTGVSSSETYLF